MQRTPRRGLKVPEATAGSAVSGAVRCCVGSRDHTTITQTSPKSTHQREREGEEERTGREREGEHAEQRRPVSSPQRTHLTTTTTTIAPSWHHHDGVGGALLLLLRVVRCVCQRQRDDMGGGCCCCAPFSVVARPFPLLSAPPHSKQQQNSNDAQATLGQPQTGH